MPKRKKRYIIGIDEVGRGSLAGPVVVAAVAAPTKFRIDPSGILRKQNLKLRINKDINSKFLILNSKLAKLRDSKKLSPKQREIWFQYIKKQPKIFYMIASVSPKIIDKINVSNTANLAATRAFKKLVKCFTIVKHLTKSKVEVFLDGGLYLNTKTLMASGYWPNSKTIIKGDEKIPAIMLASIVAKVRRDKIMVKLHKKYPQYAFDRHKGYGTKKHIKAIRKFGLSPVHRKSFKSI